MVQTTGSTKRSATDRDSTDRAGAWPAPDNRMVPGTPAVADTKLTSRIRVFVTGEAHQALFRDVIGEAATSLRIARGAIKASMVDDDVLVEGVGTADLALGLGLVLEAQTRAADQMRALAERFWPSNLGIASDLALLASGCEVRAEHAQQLLDDLLPTNEPRGEVRRPPADAARLLPLRATSA